MLKTYQQSNFNLHENKMQTVTGYRLIDIICFTFTIDAIWIVNLNMDIDFIKTPTTIEKTKKKSSKYNEAHWCWPFPFFTIIISNVSSWSYKFKSIA